MTDTTKQEVDMGYIHAVFSSLADTIVKASELPKQMEAIRSDMNGLTSDLERTKARNIELDTMLADTRRQRDEAEQALSGVRSELGMVRNEVGHLKSENEDSAMRVKSLQFELEQAKKDRDDAGFKHLEADERATQAEAKLKKLREALGMTEPEPKPTPKPETETNYRVPEPQPETTQSPPPVQQDGEASEPAKVYEGDQGFDWGKAHYYDSAKSRWYNYAD